MADTPPERALVALAQRGDDSAFGELVRRRQTLVRGLLRQWCGDAQLADDLAQDTFVHAWKHLGQLQTSAAFGTWLRQIALNLWLQHARKRRIRLTELGTESETRVDETWDAGGALDLDRALATLRPGERLCIVLSFGEGMSHGEVAQATGFPLGTVKTLIARGMAKLRSLLGHPGT